VFTELSDYERERQANLARNRAYMQSLGLHKDARALRDEKSAKAKVQPPRSKVNTQTYTRDTHGTHRCRYVYTDIYIYI